MTKRKKAPHFTQPAEFKIIKLKRAGPKPGQSLNAYLSGKTKGHQELMDDPLNKLNDLF